MENIKDIEILLSRERIAVYKKVSANSWLEEYKKDIELGKQLYEKLHFLEVFLRNKIDYEFQKVFGSDWLNPSISFDNSRKTFIQDDGKYLFSPNSLARLNEIKNRKDKVSNLSFGFWSGLFHSYYHRNVWGAKRLLPLVLPYLNTSERSLKQIEKELDVIRKLRNRVFHFEPLINSNTQECLVLIEKYVRGIGGN